MPNLHLIKHIPIKGTITCLTGLRIGGSKEDIDIGGMDNPVIRHPVTQEPYIPGSSLKGKLRSVLEYRYCYNRIGSNGEPCGCGAPPSKCPVCTLFGPHKKTNHDLGPTRLLVRDASLKTTDAQHDWVEEKSETMIDRRTGIAKSGSLRSSERIAAGAQFDFEISVRIFEDDDEKELLARVREGLSLIEKEYLGASGSRGYGQVKFTFEEPPDWQEPA